eukprot:IDg12293t1
MKVTPTVSQSQVGPDSPPFDRGTHGLMKQVLSALTFAPPTVFGYQTTTCLSTLPTLLISATDAVSRPYSPLQVCWSRRTRRATALLYSPGIMLCTSPVVVNEQADCRTLHVRRSSRNTMSCSDLRCHPLTSYHTNTPICAFWGSIFSPSERHVSVPRSCTGSAPIPLCPPSADQSLTLWLSVSGPSIDELPLLPISIALVAISSGLTSLPSLKGSVPSTSSPGTSDEQTPPTSAITALFPALLVFKLDPQTVSLDVVSRKFAHLKTARMEAERFLSKCANAPLAVLVYETLKVSQTPE